jgi:ATP/maltotriose-dependent transcriptional regulator MalT
VRGHVEPGFTAEEGLREVREALHIFEELGDERGQALAWNYSAMYSHHYRGHYAEARRAIERALAHATAAGDERLQDDARAAVGYCLFRGADSLDELLAYAENLDQAGREGRAIPFRVLLAGVLGRAHAMRGELETARTLIAEERAALEELGNTFWGRVVAATEFGAIEILAGDPAAAERHLREGYSALEEAGETGNRSTVAALLAEAVDAQGRHAEAERYTRISDKAAARDDYFSQVLWRAVRAKAFARQGRVVEGERLAREAVRLAEGTDDINCHGDALMALAEVVRLAERPSEALPHIQQALNLYEQKGNVISAGRARALLGELEAVPSP